MIVADPDYSSLNDLYVHRMRFRFTIDSMKSNLFLKIKTRPFTLTLTALFLTLLLVFLSRPVGTVVSTSSTMQESSESWVNETLARMSLDEKIGQLIVPTLFSTFTSTDSDTFDDLARLVTKYHVGGIHVFGGREPAPRVLLGSRRSRAILGHPLAAASLLDRLQALASVPLLNTGDFETGVGFRMESATVFPRAMAFGATGDDQLVYEAAHITALEALAIGVHVNFAPVADVNNNPRNPVINTRSFGEDPRLVSTMVSAYVRGLQDAGMVATLKHFPGHGDTEVDTHLGLATILHSRDRLEKVEWAPFRAGVIAGAGAIMTAHIELPAIESRPGTPTTFSAPIVQGVLRDTLGFDGLVYTDSMSMRAVSDMVSPGEAAVRAIRSGHDIVLHSPDPVAAFTAVQAAVVSGEIDQARLDRSVIRVLKTKADLGLHKSRRSNLKSVTEVVGRRSHWAMAEKVSRRSITLIRDDSPVGTGSVPLPLPRDSEILYLSILDHDSDWGIAWPSRTFIPELEQRWPRVTAIELSDRSSRSEIELVRSMVPRYDGVIASIFVRATSGHNRMSLSPALVDLLRELTKQTTTADMPFVTVIFGNPYVATALTSLTSVLLTFDLYDLAEKSVVRALAGETSIGGRLPIELPGVAALGYGLDRPTTGGVSEY